MLRVLTYHRIAFPGDPRVLNPFLVSATPPGFEEQMRFLARHYQVVSMNTVLEAGIGGGLPRRAVLLTFDDAYRDFADRAWPVLKRYRLPVTLFVPTAYPGDPKRVFWWDRLYAAIECSSRASVCHVRVGRLDLRDEKRRPAVFRKLVDHLEAAPHPVAMQTADELCEQLGGTPASENHVLTWAQLRQLAREGVTVAAHTRNHPIMTQISEKEIREEVAGAQQDLIRELGAALPVFCYPSGKHDDVVVRVLAQEGFRMAFTTLTGQNDLRTADLLRLRRTNITTRTTLRILRVRLLRFFTHVDRWRLRHQERTLVSRSARGN